MAIPDKIIKLVERFDTHFADYKRSTYNETQTRREFIDPFFQALGWDVDNSQGRSESLKEVIHEAKVNVDDAQKAPDYCFRIQKDPKFFVEAKKPSVSLKDNIHPAYQLRRYGWSAKLPVSILTDFEEFAVYDCRVMPEQQDKATNARLLYLTYSEYLEKWDDLFTLFSRDAIASGSLDRYVETHKDKRGILPVDVAFLQEIEQWRETLAQHLAARNPGLTRRELNYAVQRTIDRIIFLRICEDRGIEPYGKLHTILDAKNLYANLMQRFKDADDRYNSGIFHFKPERDHKEDPDTLTPNLTIDDDILKGILNKLYFPASPYAFKVIPAEILGQVYEQFLGKVICLDTKHRATVEEKPEVKKAGGVYYTPDYIVEYIVTQTVGELLHGKTPKQVETLTILDPACGSGSFLIGAYQYLLDWYLDQYVADNPQKWSKGKRPRLYKTDENDWKLTIDERKRILLTHMYGVDIDDQAVEVTKLSLLLKVLEGEDDQSISSQMALFHERVLPNLASNIKCGNSLIENDFYIGKQTTFDEDELIRVNAFDWKNEFPDILNKGGFNVVIGNPPYLYSAGQEYAQYFNRKYFLSQYQTDFYVYFIEKVLHIAQKGGRFSFIVSDSWLNSEHFSKIRNHLLTSHKIELVAIFDYPVFPKVTLENSIFVISISEQPEKFPIIRFSKPFIFAPVNSISPSDAIKRGLIDPHFNTIFDKIISKIEKGTHPLENDVEMNRGIHAYRTDGYGRSKFKDGYQTKKDKELCSYHADTPLDDTYLPELHGKDVHRFIFKSSGKYLSYGAWLAEPRKPELFLKPKITFRKILGKKLHGTYIEKPMALDQSLYICISRSDNIMELKYFLGVLLSTLGAWGRCALNCS